MYNIIFRTKGDVLVPNYGKSNIIRNQQSCCFSICKDDHLQHRGTRRSDSPSWRMFDFFCINCYLPRIDPRRRLRRCAQRRFGNRVQQDFAGLNTNPNEANFVSTPADKWRDSAIYSAHNFVDVVVFSVAMIFICESAKTS